MSERDIIDFIKSCKPSEPDANTTFLLLMQDGNMTQKQYDEYIDRFDINTDRKFLELIFKKCPYHECRLRIGKMLYYNRLH